MKSICHISSPNNPDFSHPKNFKIFNDTFLYKLESGQRIKIFFPPKFEKFFTSLYLIQGQGGFQMILRKPLNLHARSNDIIIGTFVLIFSFNLIGK
jgi:hypothetical protein